MRRSRLLGVGCALVVLALALVPAAPPAYAQSVAEDKIDPALRDLMQADPLALLPVIVEMQHPLQPFIGAPNVDRALEALGLLRFNGVAGAALSLIDAAAGFANATGIEALNLAPNVARIHHDATVGPQRSVAPPVIAPPDQLSEAYPRVVNADRVWQQGTTGRGVTVAVLDSGVAADADLIQPTNRILASVNFADVRTASDPGGHGTHIAGIIAGNGSRSGARHPGERQDLLGDTRDRVGRRAPRRLQHPRHQSLLWRTCQPFLPRRPDVGRSGNRVAPRSGRRRRVGERRTGT